jgi:uncharacterized membrane protein YgdD (TMEM256/DUF423 family)
MNKRYLKTAALLGLTAVMLGAFGAHGLKKIASPEAVESFKTGVLYHFLHAFAILVTAFFMEQLVFKKARIALLLWVSGIVVFSGSLYVMALFPETKSILGPITPIGGLSLMAGWFFLFLSVEN